MKTAELQAKKAGYFHFDRQKQDYIHHSGKVSDEWIDKIKAYLADPVMDPYDIKYNQIYKTAAEKCPNKYDNGISPGYTNEYSELLDTYESLKNAGYPDDYVSFQCINVPKTHEIDKRAISFQVI
jgi:hypothetical protein